MAQSSFRDWVGFFGSTATALTAQGQRVRSLIGEAHWLSDGTYKERLLKNAIREIVPSTFKIGDGFLIYQKARNKENFEVSRQIDVLVYDDRFVAPIFRDGDFVIILAETALAAIEVKSSWGDNCKKLKNGINKLQTAHRLYRLAKEGYNPDLFTACIAYAASSQSNRQEPGSNRIITQLIRQMKHGFTKGLEKYRKIGPNITFDHLRTIDHHQLTRSLCPQMVLSLDAEYVLTPICAGSADPNKWNFYCPVVQQVLTTAFNENGKPISLSLHLFLGTLRYRCMEWLYNNNRNVSEFGSMGIHLSNVVFSDQQYPSKDELVALIPAIEGIHEIFPNVQFR